MNVKNIKEQLQLLVEGANEILEIYHANMNNEEISVDLRQFMAANIVILEELVSETFKFMSLNEKNKEEKKILYDLFEIFQKKMFQNADIIDTFFEFEQK